MNSNRESDHYTIDLNGDKDNLHEQCKLFLERLSESYDIFKNQLKEDELKWSPYLNDNQVIFTPQEIATKSPLTIIDSPWGSGKTYFIESVAKYFIDNKTEIKSNKKICFERIIIIDTWKYSNSGNVVEQVMLELFYILSSKSDKNKENWKKVGIFFANRIAISMLNGVFHTDIGKINEDEDFEKLIKNIEENNSQKTIVFFDNIERLGSSSLNVLKAIQKLSSFNFFCFIFPVYYEKLNNIAHGISGGIQGGEFPINKFINLSYFKLENNFIDLMKNNGFSDEFSIIINSFIVHESSENKLTIRQVKNIFDHNKLSDLYEDRGSFVFVSQFCELIKQHNKIGVEKYLTGFLNVFFHSFEEQRIIFNKEAKTLDNKGIFKIIPKDLRNELIIQFWYRKNDSNKKSIFNELNTKKIQVFITSELSNINVSISNKNIGINNLQITYVRGGNLFGNYHLLPQKIKKEEEELKVLSDLKDKYELFLRENTENETELHIYLVDIFEKMFENCKKKTKIISDSFKIKEETKEDKLFLKLIKKWDNYELRIFQLEKDEETRKEFLKFILGIE